MMKFEEILTLATLVSGLIWAFDEWVFKPKRLAAQIHGGTLEEMQEPKLAEYSRSFFPVLLTVLLLRSFLAEPFRIPSGSMRPTLLEGDFILVNKFHYGLRLPVLHQKIWSISDPQRGDVIVFRHQSGKDLIKRVVGLPGDKIRYVDGLLYVNDEPVRQEFQERTLDFDPYYQRSWPVIRKQEYFGETAHDIYLQSEARYRVVYPFADVIVPENSYFVLGDNRDHSDDSRNWGFVEDKTIIGQALCVWLSWDNQHKDVRWDRLGKKL